jgi:hypothetical protein
MLNAEWLSSLGDVVVWSLQIAIAKDSVLSFPFLLRPSIYLGSLHCFLVTRDSHSMVGACRVILSPFPL